MDKNIGLKCYKDSHKRKKFKSGLYENTIKGIINHPKLNIPAYTFVEDDSYVECRRCVILEQIAVTKKQLVDYLDQELSLFQYYFPDYVSKNKNVLTTEDAYILGTLSNNFQYYTRCLKDAQVGSIRKNCDEDKHFLVNYEIALEKFPDLVEFLVEEYEEDLEILKESDPIKYYQLTTFMK
jgi:hypothetical protein